MERSSDVLELVPSLKARGEAFALATVVRTVAATAAKAGAKAIVRSDGTISDGWIGGGCARGAVVKAAREAIADGKARLISVQPLDVLQEHGVSPGDEREGVRFARNACPSHGTMDIFVEPVLPRPEVVLCGSSPVAVAIADLARRIGFDVTVCAPGRRAGRLRRGRTADRRLSAAGVERRRAFHRRLDPEPRRRGGARGGAGGGHRLRRLCRQPPEGRDPEGGARPARRRRTPAGGAPLTGRPRSRRGRPGGNRPLDPRRDHRLPPRPRPTGKGSRRRRIRPSRSPTAGPAQAG